jgi:hypothetical protein
MLSISHPALREGCDRARDLFLLSRLQGFGAGAVTMAAVFRALGVDSDMREELDRAVLDLVPVDGVPALEATIASAMLSGVLVGLLVADSALPADELNLPVSPGLD